MILFRELTDIEKVQELMASFHKAFPIAVGISDADGTWLVQEGWSSCCMNYFRTNPKSLETCIQSDNRMNEQLSQNVYCIHKCGHGLTDIGHPIMVYGERVATLWLGQFFYDAPDLDYYREYAKKFGFPPDEFVESIRSCPIYTPDEVEKQAIYFIKFCEFLAESGIQYHRRMKAEEEVRRINQNLETTILERTAELEKAKEAAEASNRAKTIFLSNMSHDLRTPLNAVLGYSHLLMNSPATSDKQAETIRIIVRSGEHLLDIINNVLDISKIESGKVEMEESEFNLHQMLNEVSSMLHIRAKEKGLVLNYERSPDLPNTIRTDCGKLRQTLINLLNNSVNYTQQGEVNLRATVTRKDPSAPFRIKFEVEDTGPGIKPEDRERIFLPFTRLSGHSYSESGTGLGLAICKQFVELLGGKLDIAGEAGKSALFFFEIPVEVVDVPVSRYDEIPEKPMSFFCKLLIAEDDQSNRELLRDFLRSRKFPNLEIMEATNGEEAVAMYEQWHPDIIMMDLHMPVVNGKEAARRIRAFAGGAKTVIIAITGDLEKEEIEQLTSVFDDIIYKPYRYEKIIEKTELFVHKVSNNSEKTRAYQYDLIDFNIHLAEGQPRYRLLVAEDHPENRKLLMRILEPIGFDLQVAENGREAVSIAEEWNPHLIFMDIRMPILSGIDATKKIRAMPSGNTIKIIALTAHALENERRKILEAGCDDFIRKPYKHTQIINTLTRYLDVRLASKEKL